MLVHRISFFAILFSLSSAAIVKWLPNESFNLPKNFNNGKLPCSKETVVFPKVITSAVKLESEVEAAAFVLPVEGEIILDGLIALGASVADNNCTNGTTFYMDKKQKWQSAGVWSSARFNKATPDSYRIPCYDDAVIFPDTRYTVILPNADQHIKSLVINNNVYTESEFREFVRYSSEGQQSFVLNDFLTTGIKIKEPVCEQRFGCPCQKNPLEIDCSNKYCPKPACVTPIKPLGFCCNVCGGYIEFDKTVALNSAFKELLDDTLNSYNGSVVYHFGFTPVPNSHTLQLIVVDVEEYTGTSAEMITSVNYVLERNGFYSLNAAKISGGPLSKAGLGGKIFVSVFFAVVLVMGAVYVYYYGMPKIELPNLNRTRGMFSRFQNRSDSVVSLTRRDSVVLGTSRTAFRNPMYDSKRGRVLVEESVVEE